MLNNAQITTVKEWVVKNKASVREAVQALYPDYDMSKDNMAKTQEAVFAKFPDLKRVIVQSRLARAQNKNAKK
jgi:hypothetical protein